MIEHSLGLLLPTWWQPCISIYVVDELGVSDRVIHIDQERRAGPQRLGQRSELVGIRGLIAQDLFLSVVALDDHDPVVRVRDGNVDVWIINDIGVGAVNPLDAPLLRECLGARAIPGSNSDQPMAERFGRIDDPVVGNSSRAEDADLERLWHHATLTDIEKPFACGGY